MHCMPGAFHIYAAAVMKGETGAYKNFPAPRFGGTGKRDERSVSSCWIEGQAQVAWLIFEQRATMQLSGSDERAAIVDCSAS